MMRFRFDISGHAFHARRPIAPVSAIRAVRDSQGRASMTKFKGETRKASPSNIDILRYPGETSPGFQGLMLIVLRRRALTPAGCLSFGTGARRPAPLGAARTIAAAGFPPGAITAPRSIAAGTTGTAPGTTLG